MCGTFQAVKTIYTHQAGTVANSLANSHSFPVVHKLPFPFCSHCRQDNVPKLISIQYIRMLWNMHKLFSYGKKNESKEATNHPSLFITHHSCYRNACTFPILHTWHTIYSMGSSFTANKPIFVHVVDHDLCAGEFIWHSYAPFGNMHTTIWEKLVIIMFPIACWFSEPQSFHVSTLCAHIQNSNYN